MKDQQKELSIKTVPVEIRVLTVDGKRMTKSVFNQITEVTHAGKILKINESRVSIGCVVLGWVYSGVEGDLSGQYKHVVYHDDGVLMRTWDGDVYDSIRNNIKDRDVFNPLIIWVNDAIFNPSNQIFISI